jgi:hypothetical protein
LRFDDAAHRYYDARGEEVPGVTSMVRWQSGTYWHGASEWHAERGRRVHTLVELDSLGILDEATVGDDLAPYLEAWRTFVAYSGFVVDDREWVVYHETLRFAGRVDLVGRLPGSSRPWVLDVKSGAKADWHVAQTGLYRLAVSDELRINPVSIGHGRLYLTPAGRYNLVLTDPSTDVDDWAWVPMAWWRDHPLGPQKGDDG